MQSSNSSKIITNIFNFIMIANHIHFIQKLLRVFITCALTKILSKYFSTTEFVPDYLHILLHELCGITRLPL